jgi:hypothetical protein
MDSPEEWWGRVEEKRTFAHLGVGDPVACREAWITIGSAVEFALKAVIMKRERFNQWPDASSVISTVEFYGDQICAVEEGGDAFVALRPIVETFGLSWSGQFERVQRTPVLARAVRKIRTPFGYSGAPELVCMAVKRLPMWLATIQVGSIKDEAVRGRIELYQEECADVLAEHFNGPRREVAADADVMPKGPAPIDQYATAPIAELRRQVEMIQSVWGTASAREAYLKFGLMKMDAFGGAPTQYEMFRTAITIEGTRVRKDGDE